MRDRYVDAGGIRTRYVEAGAGGVPLVMLHGLSGVLEDWGGMVEALARHRRVIAFDLLGCGKTDKPAASAYAPRQMRDHARDVIAALDLGRVDLNGWSMGGRIALDLAHAEPARVRRLVLTAPAGIGPDSILDLSRAPLRVLGEVLSRPGLAGWRILRNALREDRGDEVARLAARRLRMAADPGARRAFHRQLRSIMGPAGFREDARRALLARLPQIGQPTLAIWGRGDMFVPARHGAILARRMPRCRLELLDRCGHMPQLERPGAYRAAIEDFLG